MGVEHETEIDLNEDVMDQDLDAEDRGDELTEDQIREWELDEEEQGESDDDTDDAAHDDDDAADSNPDDQGNADAGGDQPDADAEQGQKGSRVVPHARFNEVNEQYKQEREARLRLEEELARLRGLQQQQQGGDQAQATADDVQQAMDESDFDFDEAEERYSEALYDGDTEAAKKIRAEIRAKEREAAEAAAAAVIERERAEMQAKQQQEQIQGVVAKAYKRYPFLNPDSGEMDQDAVDEVVALRNLYLQRGMPAAEAIAKAVDKVGPRYAGDTGHHDDAEQQAGKSNKSLTKQRKETIERNMERAERIPPATAGVGERARKVDYASLSDEEFARLSEEEKRRARGDYL